MSHGAELTQHGFPALERSPNMEEEIIHNLASSRDVLKACNHLHQHLSSSKEVSGKCLDRECYSSKISDNKYRAIYKPDLTSQV